MDNLKKNNPVDLHDISEGDNANSYESFKEKLIQVQEFPGVYTFKFIVNGNDDKVAELKAVFPNDEFKINPSKTGKYVSVTVNKQVDSADEVVGYYKQAGKIEGIMLL